MNYTGDCLESSEQSPVSCCKVDGCQKPVHVKSKQLCSVHYERLRTRGSTEDPPRARLPLEARFWKYVDKKGPDECWPWNAKSKVDGYGTLSIGGRGSPKILAHRLSWQIHNGGIPHDGSYHGIVVMHKCDNRACVNPEHLILGTQADNVKDMDNKGRRVTSPRLGEDNGFSRFTESDVRFMRKSPLSNADLGRLFDCERSTISGIRSRKTWRHIA